MTWVVSAFCHPSSVLEVTRCTSDMPRRTEKTTALTGRIIVKQVSEGGYR